jgi:hypothetical protein
MKTDIFKLLATSYLNQTRLNHAISVFEIEKIVCQPKLI